MLSGAEIQLFFVAVKVYIPVKAGSALAKTGFWEVLLKPRGPVQLQVTPAESASAKILSVSPSHIGVLLVAVTIGGLGSVRVTLLNGEEVQLLAAVTVMLLYTAASRLSTIILPVLLLERFRGV